MTEEKEDVIVEDSNQQSCGSTIEDVHCLSNTTDMIIAGSQGDDNARKTPRRRFPTCWSGRKKALLIACTYQHTTDPTMSPLKYSHKDPVNLKNLLLEHGYKDKDIMILVDTGDNKETYPTRVNIIKHIKELVNGAEAGDSFFIHFSGHGDQRDADEDEFELDGMDECIYPCDYHELEQAGKEYYILDNLLRELLVDPLSVGCRLLALFDCCSSGTVLDLPINEEILIGRSSLVWSRGGYRGQTQHIGVSSDLIVGSALTEEPAEDCSADYSPVEKPLPARVLRLRRGAQQGRKSHSLQPDLSAIAQPQEGYSIEKSEKVTDQYSVAKPFPIVEKVQARQGANQRSRTLPIYLYARRLQNRGTVHLLPLMDPRGTEDVSEEAIKNTKVPTDTRVINADVLCIASCRDDGQTYETSRGGVLVQAFCAVIDAAKRDGEVLTLEDLKCALRERLEKIHIAGVEGMMKKDPSIKAEDFEAPIPQFSYSQEYDCNSIFTMY